MIVAAGPPLIAILLALGALGWLDFRLNMFLNVMTPLIMVISFSDSMQLTFAARDRLLAGETKFEALHNAIMIVGPVCARTHAPTAAVSFVALQFSSLDLIRSFGEAGFIATIIALAAVLVLMPLLGVLFLRGESAFAAEIAGADFGVEALRRFCGQRPCFCLGLPAAPNHGATTNGWPGDRGFILAQRDRATTPHR